MKGIFGSKGLIQINNKKEGGYVMFEIEEVKGQNAKIRVVVSAAQEETLSTI